MPSICKEESAGDSWQCHTKLQRLYCCAHASKRWNGSKNLITQTYTHIVTSIYLTYKNICKLLQYKLTYMYIYIYTELEMNNKNHSLAKGLMTQSFFCLLFCSKTHDFCRLIQTLYGKLHELEILEPLLVQST